MKKLINKFMGALIKNEKLNNGVFLAACIGIGLDLIAIEWTMFASGARSGVDTTINMIEKELLKAAKESENE